MKGPARAAISLLLLLGGCRDRPETTGIVVEVSSDLRVPAEIDRLTVRVWNAAGRLVHDLPFALHDERTGSRLPARLGLAPDGPSAGPVTVEATASLGPAPVVSRRATVSFTEEEVVVLRLALPRELGPALPADAGVSPPGDAAPGRRIGEACGRAEECASGFCADGVCCGAACTDLCQACRDTKTGRPDGQCYPVKAGEDPDVECPADDAASCGRDGTCDGAGQCRRYGPSTPCSAGACSGAMFTPARTCDGRGACGPSTPRGCGDYACAPTGCATSCQGDAACAATAFCNGGLCVPKKSVGQPCGGARECSSGICAAAVCG